MNTIKVAVDLDGTLADIHSVWIAFHHYGEFTIADIRDWNGFPNGITPSQFIKESDEIWREDWLQIRSLEWSDFIEPSPYSKMYPYFIGKFGNYHIDIVTGRQTDQAILKLWLDVQKVPYHKIVQVRASEKKHELDYNYFIDDYPYLWRHLKDGQQHILFDRPWNQHVGPEKKLFRVNSIASAFAHISHLED